MTLTGCVIVSGMPGAGKSTVARLVAELLPRGAMVSGDAVNQMVRAPVGGIWHVRSRSLYDPA